MRRIVSLCAAGGIACPSFSASLGYLDQYRRARLPANLTQVSSEGCFAAWRLLRVTMSRPRHNSRTAGYLPRLSHHLLAIPHSM